MELVEKINEILSKKFLENGVYGTSVNPTNQSYFLQLKETDNEHKSESLKEVIIEWLHEDSICIKLDHKLTIPVMLSNSEGLQKRCDYLILTQTQKSNKKIALFIELKSKKQGVEKQLKGGACLFDYLNSVLKHFSDFDELEEYKKYFILFYKQSIKKLKDPVIESMLDSKYIKYPISMSKKYVSMKSIIKYL